MRIFRSRMERNLTFARILKETTEANFHEVISLSTDEFLSAGLVQESLNEMKITLSLYLKTINDTVNSELKTINDTVNSKVKTINGNLHCLENIIGFQFINQSNCEKPRGS